MDYSKAKFYAEVAVTECLMDGMEFDWPISMVVLNIMRRITLGRPVVLYDDNEYYAAALAFELWRKSNKQGGAA